MILFKQPSALSHYLSSAKQHQTIGFVPTMGALHEGHLQLIRASVAHSDLTVVSIFVNPTQFNDPADFEKYPVTIEADLDALLQNQASLLFLPQVSVMYPNGTSGMARYDLGNLEDRLEGKFRPGHFQGVAQIMDRLLDIVRPHNLFMGSKDYQQCLVIEQLINLKEYDTQLYMVPTIREKSGLAMSSRNMRLSASAKADAVRIYQSLSYIKDNLLPGDTSSLVEQAKNMLRAKSFNIDYLEIVNAETLEAVSVWDGEEKVLAITAAFIEGVRLIDNLPLN